MKISFKKPHIDSVKVSLIQSGGLIIYCLLVGLIMWRGDVWFNNIDGLLGPTLVLTLFAVSALMCGLIVFGYPTKLYLESKSLKEPFEIVIYTALWLIITIALTLIFSTLF